jgi:hypothetical protein
VQETCKGALAAGFQVTLLQGAHSTYDSEEMSAIDAEKAVEELLRSQGARVVPWEDELSSWRENGTVSVKT